MVVSVNKARITKRWKLEIEIAEDLPKTEFQGHTSGIEWPTNQTAVTWKGGDDNTLEDVADGDQVCNVTMAQDLTAGSLWRICRQYAGKRATLTLYPSYDDPSFGVQSTITIMRPPLTVNKSGQFIEHTVGMPSSVPVDVIEEPDPEALVAEDPEA